MSYTLHPLGENAVMIELGNELNLDTHQKVQAISSYIEEHPFEWMMEYIPAFSTVTVFYNPMTIINNLKRGTPYQYVCQQLHQLLTQITLRQFVESRVV
ncbi:MAG: carboxyltransferase domain-containing protein, partial [Heyndrickxia sp.]